MRFDNVYIESIASFIPDNYEQVSDAIARNKVNPKEVKGLGYKQLSISTASFKEMCLIVAKDSLKEGSNYESNLTSIYLSYTHWHGNRYFWSPASYIQNNLNLSVGCASYQLHQGCNGMAAAIEQAALRLTATANDIRSLIVGADKFSRTSFNRWNSDIGLLYGDGAAAVVLTNVETPIRILAINTITDSSMEVLHRDANEKEQDYEDSDELFMVRDVKMQALAKLGATYLMDKTKHIVSNLINKTLHEAGIDIENDIKIIFPNLGEAILNSSYRVALDERMIEVGQELQDITGHLGTTDSIIKLDRLIRSRDKDIKNKYVLLISAGSGFSWSAILIKLK